MPNPGSKSPDESEAVSISLAEKFDPSSILARLNAKATVHDDGRVSYTGWDFQENVALLHGMVATTPSVSRSALRYAINRAIGVCVRDKKLTGGYFIGAIRRHYEDRIGREDKAFVLLTEFSVHCEALIGSYRVGAAQVRLLNGGFPKKYSSRSESSARYRQRALHPYPADYQKVCVEINARSDGLAAQSGLDAVDALRGFFNMQANLAMEMQLGNEQFKPINRITLGGLHTLHVPAGAQANDTFWYEPIARFQKRHAIKPEKGASVAKQARTLLGYLNRSPDRPFADLLVRSLIQYARAFDELDPTNCLLKAWTVVEQLVGDDANGDGDRVVRRVSFLYTSHQDQRLTLEVIRRARNNLAHRGQGAEHLRTYCYHLQRHFIDAFVYYLSNLRAGRSRDVANMLLDLPPNIDDMRKRAADLRATMDLVRRGLRFRAPRKVK